MNQSISRNFGIGKIPTEALFEAGKSDSTPSKSEYASIFQTGKNKSNNENPHACAHTALTPTSIHFLLFNKLLQQLTPDNHFCTASSNTSSLFLSELITDNNFWLLGRACLGKQLDIAFCLHWTRALKRFNSFLVGKQSQESYAF